MRFKNRKFGVAAVVVGLVVIALISGFDNVLSSLSGWLARIDPYRDISVQEAYAVITYQPYRNITILDVRTQSEYDMMHINNSILIPYDELEARINELAGNETYEIIVHCKSGYRSAIASDILANHGFARVYNMVGGIEAWVDAGYPVVMMLLLNHSVEQGVDAPDFWTKGKDADVPGDPVWSEVPHTGSKSLALIISPNSAATQWHGIRWHQMYNLDDSNCPFTRGGTYRYRAWFLTSGCQRARPYDGFHTHQKVGSNERDIFSDFLFRTIAGKRSQRNPLGQLGHAGTILCLIFSHRSLCIASTPIEGDQTEGLDEP